MGDGVEVDGELPDLLAGLVSCIFMVPVVVTIGPVAPVLGGDAFASS